MSIKVKSAHLCHLCESSGVYDGQTQTMRRWHASWNSPPLNPFRGRRENQHLLPTVALRCKRYQRLPRAHCTRRGWGWTRSSAACRGACRQGQVQRPARARTGKCAGHHGVVHGPVSVSMEQLHVSGGELSTHSAARVVRAFGHVRWPLYHKSHCGERPCKVGSNSPASSCGVAALARAAAGS